MQARQRTLRWALFIGIVCCGLAAGPTSAQTSCLTVDISRPVVFPDGTEHAGGRLVLCDWKAFTPVTRLHRSYVDGHPVQMLMATRLTNERTPDAPDEVYFRADQAGRLELVGYARTYRGRSMTVRFLRHNYLKKVNRPARATENDDLLIVMARPQ